MKDVIYNLLVTDLEYPVTSISEDEVINDIRFNYAVFKKDSPHILENLILVTSYDILNISEFESNILELSKHAHNLKYAIFCDVDDILYYKINSNNKIIEFFNLPLLKKNNKDFIQKKDLINPMNFEKTLRSISNYIYANEGLSSNQVFDEIIKIFFIKLEDENKNEHEKLDFYISEQEYESVFNFKDNKKLDFEIRINDIFNNIKQKNSKLFYKDERIKLNNKTLAYIICKLQYYNFSDFDYDIKGIIFQNIIESSQKGERGQFFTPQAVVKFIISFLDPCINFKYIDTSCGTGGFLKEIVSYILNKYNCSYKELNTFIQSNIHGIEINPDIARIAKIRFLFENGTVNNNIICRNALTMDDSMNGSYDFVITNPPFGSQGKIIDRSILMNYELGYIWKNDKKTGKISNGQVPDILFIEKCLNLLKNRGILAIILPNGDLENPSLSYVRKYIINNSKLIASIKLPDETFVPYGTGVKSSILFLQKLEGTELEVEKRNDYKIFFGNITKLGYTFNKSSKMIYKQDDKGNNILDEDFSYVAEQYKLFKNNANFMTSDNCFALNFSDLENRFDYSFYKPEFIRNINVLKKHNSVPLKSVVDILKTSSNILRNKDNIVRYIEISNINAYSTEIIGYSKMKVRDLPSRAKYEVKKGNIITSIAGNSIGTTKHATAYVTEEYDGCICTNGLRVLIAKNIDPLYLLYYLRTPYFLNQVKQFRTGAAIPNISDEDFSKILVYIPDDQVLNEIVDSVKYSFELRKKSKLLLNKKFINI